MNNNTKDTKLKLNKDPKSNPIKRKFIPINDKLESLPSHGVEFSRFPSIEGKIHDILYEYLEDPLSEQLETRIEVEILENLEW